MQGRNAFRRDVGDFRRRQIHGRDQQRESRRAAVDSLDEEYRDQPAENGIGGLDLITGEVLGLKGVVIVELRLPLQAGRCVGNVNAVSGKLVKRRLIGHGHNLSC